MNWHAMLKILARVALNRAVVVIAAVVMVPLVLIPACSKSPRQDTPVDAGDDGDDDGGNDTVDWDTEQGDFEIPPPVLMVENDGTQAVVAAVLAGGRVAVAGTHRCDNSTYCQEGDGTMLATIDADLSQDPAVGSYSLGYYPSYYSGPVALYPLDEGFLLLESKHIFQGDPEMSLSLQLTVSGWNASAEITGGPIEMGNIWNPGPASIRVHPWGAARADGSVLLGLKHIEHGETSADSTVFFQVSRVDVAGIHEVIAGPEVFPWNPSSLGDYWFYLSEDRATYEFEEGIFSIAALTHWEETDLVTSALIAARAVPGGAVEIPPMVAVLLPDEHGEWPRARHAFAARDDEVLAISTLGYGYMYPGCTTHRIATRLSAEGEIIEPQVTVSISSNCMSKGNIKGSGPAAVWSGRFFGYCDLDYRDDGRVYSFWLLDESGAVVSGPADIFWTFADFLFPYACDVVALDEERFAVALAVPREAVHVTAPLVDTPGLWLTVVEYHEPPE